MSGKYDGLGSGVVQRGVECFPCTYFSDRQFGVYFSYCLDFDEVYFYSLMVGRGLPLE